MAAEAALCGDVKRALALSVSGDENSPGWLCGEDEGKTMAPFWCPLLACHMPVFATKSAERKVNLLPLLPDRYCSQIHDT